jgi:nicotinic acetylcholine receptor
LSDVGAKRKYPFELEKAIHNVMFIQHHMQRQDEFNAVSVMQDEKKFKCKFAIFFLFYFISFPPS